MDFFYFVENVLPQLLYSLCGSRNEPLLQLDSHQALAKQFAEILHYTLKFDDLKVTLLEELGRPFSYCPNQKQFDTLHVYNEFSE